MKKSIIAGTILSVAAVTSFQASAIMGPGQIKRVKACVSVYDAGDGNVYADNCDQTKNNEIKKLKLNESGCADGQASMTFVGESPLRACMLPGIVQL